jgi:g-D-glutamyl-meso-diaminopimelate peptidase
MLASFVSLVLASITWFLPIVPSTSVSAMATTQAPTETSGDVFGYSTLGKELVAYHFGSGDRCVFLFGGIHGNERGTVSLMNYLVDELEQTPELVSEDTRVVIVPLTNPDGFFTREDKLNAAGVNLNRNFYTQDWIQKAGGDQTYAGQRPFSEYETQALRALVESCNPEIMIAYHSQGALVSPEENEASRELAAWYASLTGYEYYTDWNFAGTATRWFVETTDRTAFTVELTSHTDSDWEINKPALLQLIANK